MLSCKIRKHHIQRWKRMLSSREIYPITPTHSIVTIVKCGVLYIWEIRILNENIKDVKLYLISCLVLLLKTVFAVYSPLFLKIFLIHDLKCEILVTCLNIFFRDFHSHIKFFNVIKKIIKIFVRWEDYFIVFYCWMFYTFKHAFFFNLWK